MDQEVTIVHGVSVFDPLTQRMALEDSVIDFSDDHPFAFYWKRRAEDGDVTIAPKAPE